MKRLFLLLAILTCLLSRPSSAQDTLGVRPGDQVRVAAPECGLRSGRYEFQGVNRDSLLLKHQGEDLTCQITAVNRFEVLRGGTSSRGMGLGALIGIGVGAAVVGGAAKDASAGAVGGLAGGLIGAGLGKGPRARKSMLIGTGIGVAGGLAVVSNCNDDMGCLAVAVVVPAPIIISTVVGLVIRERRWWEEVSLPLSRFSIHRTPEGQLGVGFLVPLRK